MSIKKSSKNSLKTPDIDILKLAILLAKVSSNLDLEGLKALVSYCSAFVQDAEFQKVFKVARSIIRDEGLGDVGCDDWLVSSLYLIYEKDAENF
jgi:hypothetical protein